MAGEKEEGLLDWDFSTDGYPPGYFGEPNESFFRSLFSDEPVYTQPWFLGKDAGGGLGGGGWSPDYPKYRNYEDYFAKNFPIPDKNDYWVGDSFNQERYDADVTEWYSKKPMY